MSLKARDALGEPLVFGGGFGPGGTHQCHCIHTCTTSCRFDKAERERVRSETRTKVSETAKKANTSKEHLRKVSGETEDEYSRYALASDTTPKFNF